ncbi:MAG: FMN-binding protein, partial [Fenollaria timonensis]
DRIELVDFKDQFVDKDASNELVLSKTASGEEIQAISGSTISSRATVEAVNQAIDALSKIK